jgi:nitronate monooxygenase
MAWPTSLKPLSLPVVGAPLFIVSNPELVIAQCSSGVIGAFPALNARPKEMLANWLARITAALAEHAAADPGAEVAPFAVNQIIHTSNDRLAHDLDVCATYRVPIVVTSLGVPVEIVPKVHGWGGLVFHDAISLRHARKAIDAGVDGLILVCAGAGGHAGTLSPFAFVDEVRKIWQGPIALSGAIATGRGVLAARAIGADLAYVGTRFIATAEANADRRYKEMIVASEAADILYTPYFTGVAGNYLRRSLVEAGLDPDRLSDRDKAHLSFESGKAEGTAKAWRDILGAGQGVGAIDDIAPVAEIVARMRRDYLDAKEALCRRF